MTRLEISILGAFQAGRDGETITKFETVPTRALLVYLVMHPGVPLYREMLADLLWPEQPRKEALHALRQTLNRLRRAIEGRDSNVIFLTVTRQTIQFEPGSDYWLDANTFDSLAHTIDEHTHRHLRACVPCLQRLTEAAELYRGDLMSGFYLDSLPFQEWLMMERERLHQQAMDILYKLADCHNRLGEPKQAQYYARRQLALEPWCEEAHRQLMLALALSGQRSAALLQYETCRRTLEEELGVPPRDQTIALYEQIRDEKLAPATPPPHNLPAQITRFIGRETELEHIAELLNDPDNRLLTLVGPGGVGKTRLARQAARRAVTHFAGGTWFVPMIDVPEVPQKGVADRLATAIAGTMGITFSGQDEPQTELLRSLRAKECLLILDNFEHLTDGASFVLEILQKAPKITILVTSRTRLNVRAERLIHIAGLSVPQQAPDEESVDIEHYSSVQLFLDRATCTQEPSEYDLEQIAQICRLVEGVPLAIELASVLVEHLPPDEIVANLQRDMDFLSTTLQDVPERHRRLRAVFDSSWRLLSEQEQRALAQLAVFRGDFDRKAALSVVEMRQSELVGLVNKSLLQHSSPDRYALHALVRQFAAEKRDQFPELAAANARHSAYYLAFTGERTVALQGDTPQQAAAEIRTELANVRQAWQWTVEQVGTGQDPISHITALSRCTDGLIQFYSQIGLWREGKQVFQTAADQVQTLTQDNDQALSSEHLAIGLQVLSKLLAAHGYFLSEIGNHTDALAVQQKAMAIFEKASAALPDCNLTEQAKLLVNIGSSYDRVGDSAQAVQHLKAALVLACQVNAPRVEINALCLLGQTASEQGEYDAAKQYFDEALTLTQAQGDRTNEARTLSMLGSIAWRWGDIELAGRCIRESLEIYKELEHRAMIPRLLNVLGIVAIMQEDYEQAEVHWEESLERVREMDDRHVMADTLNNLGYINHHNLENLEKARQYYKESLSIGREIGHRQGATSTLSNLGHLHVLLGEHKDAWKYLREALSESMAIGVIPLTLDALVGVALLQAETGQGEPAAGLVGLVMHHPSVEADSVRVAETVLAKLRQAMPSAQIEAAIERGKWMALDDVVADLLKKA